MEPLPATRDDNVTTTTVEEPLLMHTPSTIELDTVTLKSLRSGLRDPIFLVLFVFHLFYIASLAISYGGVALSNTGANYWVVSALATNTVGEYAEVSDQTNYDVPAKIMGGIVLVLCTSAALSMAWIFFLSKVARFVMNTMILSIVVISTLGGFGLLAMDYASLGVFLLVVAIATMLVAFLFQARIEFASQNLAVASQAIVSIPSTMRYSLLCLFLQVIFVLIWCIAAFGFATNSFQISKYYQNSVYTLDECASYKYFSNIEVDGRSLTCLTGGTCYACLCGPSHDVVSATSECFKPRFYWSAFVFLLVSLFWTNAVLANILHGATAASVWRWWTRGQCTDSDVLANFRRMTSDSLGSICFGSLLAALIRTLRAIVSLMNRTRSQRDNRQHAHRQQLGAFSTMSFTATSVVSSLDQLAGAILGGLVVVLDRVIIYFNRYAFCIVGIDGKKTFCVIFVSMK
jgi:hypothetical protein